MKNILSALLLVSSFLLLGCGSKEPKAPENEKPSVSGEIDFDAMAKGFCNCMRPMFEMQERLTKLAEAGKEDEIAAMRDHIEQVEKDGENCVYALEEKYGVVEGAKNEERANEALKRACPDIMELMNAAAEALEE